MSKNRFSVWVLGIAILAGAVFIFLPFALKFIHHNVEPLMLSDSKCFVTASHEVRYQLMAEGQTPCLVKQ